ncbi:uncharacterized protein [Aegilops tauschii subsp. strangulata]|uniref:uncharacterized protein isoform X8 n=1 Tax=Aegilops tauschii subsp. strangulata TaxID=200361 RepID=UPI001ABC68A7|nr:uncharacterized protein LOC109740712 isoform X2 [Aegilops tauschii subsp. strangulata]
MCSAHSRLIGTVEDREGGEGCEVCRIGRKGRRSRWWSRIQRTPGDQVSWSNFLFSFFVVYLLRLPHRKPAEPTLTPSAAMPLPMIVRASSSRALPRSTMRVQLARGRLLTSGIT